jgi:hypothetical protein
MQTFFSKVSVREKHKPVSVLCQYMQAYYISLKVCYEDGAHTGRLHCLVFIFIEDIPLRYLNSTV